MLLAGIQAKFRLDSDENVRVTNLGGIVQISAFIGDRKLMSRFVVN
jgi:hypothetical protein